MRSEFLLIPHSVFQELLRLVRLAEGKLYQAKGGRALIDEIDVLIRNIETVCYTNGDSLQEQYCVEQNLESRKEVEELRQKLKAIQSILE